MLAAASSGNGARRQNPRRHGARRRDPTALPRRSWNRRRAALAARPRGHWPRRRHHRLPRPARPRGRRPGGPTRPRPPLIQHTATGGPAARRGAGRPKRAFLVIQPFLFRYRGSVQREELAVRPAERLRLVAVGPAAPAACGPACAPPGIRTSTLF